MEEPLILRRWSGRVRNADRALYIEYVAATGLAGYLATPGNRGCQVLSRDLGDGSCEVTTLSWWTSMEAIVAFAGDDPQLARYFPEDDRYLIERPKHVEHYRVEAGGAPARPGSSVR